MKNWNEIKNKIRYVIYDSSLHMTEKVEWEGDYRNEDKTNTEKEKLYNKIKEILKDLD